MKTIWHIVIVPAEAMHLNTKQRPSWRVSLVLLMVPMRGACSSNTWSDEYKKGVAALRAQKFDQAEQHFGQASKLAGQESKLSGVADSLFALARTHVEQGEFHQARPLFEQAIIEYERVNGRQSRAVAAALVELSACLI